MFVGPGRADCGQRVEELRLELTDLEPLGGADPDAVETERSRLAVESRLIGDFESEYDLEQTIVWEDGPFQTGGGPVQLESAP